jgi:hypothetical protein
MRQVATSELMEVYHGRRGHVGSVVPRAQQDEAWTSFDGSWSEVVLRAPRWQICTDGLSEHAVHVRRERDQDDGFKLGSRRDGGSDFLNRDPGGVLHRKTECPAADRGNRQRSNLVLGARRENVAVAAGEEAGLVVVTPAPYGPNRVDDESRRQTKPRSDPCLAGGAANARTNFGDAAAGLQQIRPGRRVNGTIDTTATEQRLVGSIDDGVDLEGRDVTQLGID